MLFLFKGIQWILQRLKGTSQGISRRLFVPLLL
jgi:hypothetical protein